MIIIELVREIHSFNIQNIRMYTRYICLLKITILSKNHKEMKYWIFALLLISVSTNAWTQDKELTLEDAIVNRYRNLAPDYVSGLQWIPNSNLYTYRDDSTVYVKNTKGQEKRSFSLKQLNKILGDSLKRMPYVTFVNPETIKLRTKDGTKSISLKNNTITQSSANPAGVANMDKSSNGIFAYTKENNLYIFNNGKETAVTEDSDPNHVYGQAVSRYEFGISKGTFWSPKGNFLAFYMKDESAVSDYPLVNYMERVAQLESVKYPMAGLPSQLVQLGVYNLKTGKTIYIDGQGGKEDYLTNITWSPDEKYIYIQELNRGQNHMQLNQYDAVTGNFIKTLFEEKSDTYVEPQNTLIFSERNPKHFYLKSNKDGYFHIYKYDTNGRQLAQLTSGNWEVTKVVGFDKKEKNLFIEGTKDSPIERHLYKVNTRSKKITKLTTGSGNHSISKSKEGCYFIDRYQSTDVPNNISIIDENGRTLHEILNSKDNASDYKFGENKIVEIPCPDGVNTLYGRLILPTDFDPAKKYPVIVYVYGGPHSQMVRKTWKNSARWWQYYMAQKGFISFTLDNRGTQNRGRKFEDVIHRNLGINETDDQMAGIEYLKSLDYVDTDRIGVHGWSYGGFMTMNLMMRHPETFKVGVAGGPVVDWSLYEVMYGERYMDTPEENPEGYNKTDMTKLIPQLTGDLLIIHGAQDATVVMQHTMKFLRESVKQGKQVDFFAYPIHKHNVRGMDRVHLMEKVSKYFIDNL